MHLLVSFIHKTNERSEMSNIEMNMKIESEY